MRRHRHGAGNFSSLWFFFRSFRQSVVAGLPMLLGIMFSLAFVRIAYGGLNLITSSFLSVLMGWVLISQCTGYRASMNLTGGNPA